MMQSKAKHYTHLSQAERIEIHAFLREGLSYRKIAKRLKRSHTTISKEIDRNSIDYGRGNTLYKPIKAQEMKESRRFKANLGHIKLRKNNSLRTKIWQILSDPNNCWGPDEILGYLKREGWTTVSTSTLYKYIREHTSWEKYLRYKEEGYNNRKWERKKKKTIPNVAKIDKRDTIVEERSRIGDRELDTVVGKGHSGGLFTAVERKSRYVLISKIPNHKAATLLTVMTGILTGEKIVTATSDNGVEFARLARLGKRLKIKMYTAHPYCSQERGTNEKTNGFIRRFLPKGIDIEQFTDQEIEKIQDQLNHKPRKILGYRTPYEVYHDTTISYLT